MKEPYPIYLVLKDKSVAVIGGGKIAERKIIGLLDTGATITVIAPGVTKRIRALVREGRIQLELRNMIESDLDGKPVVFAATDSDEINRCVCSLARERGALVNCVDTPEECDFFVPSFFRRGSLSFAISTGGKVPGLAKKIRKKLQRIFGEEYAAYVELLAMGRERIMKANPNCYHKKKQLIEKLIDADLLSLLRDGKQREALGLVEDVLQQNHKSHTPKNKQENLL